MFKQGIEAIFTKPAFVPVEGPKKKTDWSPSEKSIAKVLTVMTRDEISLKALAAATNYSQPLIAKVGKALVADGLIASRKKNANAPTYFWLV